MYIARLLFPVKVLGPGNRIGIWMSGCGHKCAGCSNPELWEQREQQRVTLENLKKMVDPIFENYEVDGVTPVSYTHLDVYKRQGKEFEKDETCDL